MLWVIAMQYKFYFRPYHFNAATQGSSPVLHINKFLKALEIDLEHQFFSSQSPQQQRSRASRYLGQLQSLAFILYRLDIPYHISETTQAQAKAQSTRQGVQAAPAQPQLPEA